jgi:hypothetical protein
MGWMKVNGILMPAARSIGGFSTDQACMKHCKQELGAAPPKIKITAYFAELVQACTAAVQAWKGRGRMDMDPITVPSNGTIWHIVVGSGGQPIVHHIDSGYGTPRGSTTRNRPVPYLPEMTEPTRTAVSRPET